MERGFIGLNVAVLAVGDALAISDEPPAQLTVDRFTQAGHKVVATAVVGDFVQVIRAKLLEWVADPTIDVIIATAGTKTEYAAAALAPLVTKPLVGFSDLFRYMTFEEIGTAAMLVDADAAQCKNTFVFLLPASIGAVRTALDRLIIPQLDYRTKPANLVMRMPRVAHVELPEKAPALEPWISPKKPTAQFAAVPAPPRPPARAATMPPPVPERSVSRKMDAIPQFTEKEITSQGVAPAPPRPKASTISAPLPMKAPAAPAPMIEELEAAPPRTREFEAVEKTGPIPKTPSPSVMIDSSLSQPITVASPAIARAVQRPVAAEDLDDHIDYLPSSGVSKKFVFAWLGIAIAGAAMVIVFLFLKQDNKDANAAAAIDPPGDRVAARDTIPDTRSEPPTPPTADPVPVMAAVDAAPDEIDMPLDPDPPVGKTPPVVAKTPPVAKDSGVAKVPPVAKQPTEPKVEKEPELKPVTAESGCDEVSCVLDRFQLPCCTRYKPKDEPVELKPKSDLPEAIDRAMIVEGVGKMKPAVVRCGEIHNTKGTVKLHVTVSAGGKVESVNVTSSPEEAIGTCVATAIKKASFAKTQNGGSFGYPFVF